MSPAVKAVIDSLLNLTFRDIASLQESTGMTDSAMYSMLVNLYEAPDISRQYTIIPDPDLDPVLRKKIMTIKVIRATFGATLQDSKGYSEGVPFNATKDQIRTLRIDILPFGYIINMVVS